MLPGIFLLKNWFDFNMSVNDVMDVGVKLFL